MHPTDPKSYYKLPRESSRYSEAGRIIFVGNMTNSDPSEGLAKGSLVYSLWANLALKKEDMIPGDKRRSCMMQ